MKIVYVHMGWPMAYPFSPRTWSWEEWTRWLGLIHRHGVETLMLWPGYEFIDPEVDAEIENMAEWTNHILLLCHNIGLKVWLGRSINAVCSQAHKNFRLREVRDTSEIHVTSKDYHNKVIQVLNRLFKDCPPFEGWWCIDRDPGACLGTTAQDFAKAYQEQFLAVGKAQQALYWMWGGWTDALNQKAEWRLEPQSFWQDSVHELVKIFPQLSVLFCWPGHIASLGDYRGKVYPFPYHAGEPEPSIPWTYMGTQEPSYHFNPIENRSSRQYDFQEPIFNIQTPCLRTPHLIHALQGVASTPTLLAELERHWCWSEASLNDLRKNWLAMQETLSAKGEILPTMHEPLSACTSAPSAYALSDWIHFTGAHYPSKRGFLHERFFHA